MASYCISKNLSDEEPTSCIHSFSFIVAISLFNSLTICALDGYFSLVSFNSWMLREMGLITKSIQI